jgi:Spy/CpxP family protein refolding chaperone
MNKMTKGKAIFYLVAIFIAGAACGTILGYTSGRQQAVSPARQKEMSDKLLHRLQTRLSLTPEQFAQIKPIVEQNSAAMQAIHRESWQRVSDNFKRMNARIASYLTDEQRRKLEAMESERCENVRKKCGTPRGNANADGGAAHDGRRGE